MLPGGTRVDPSAVASLARLERVCHVPAVPEAGAVIFAVTYVLWSARRLGALGLDRPAAALLGAVACVALGVLEPEAALEGIKGLAVLTAEDHDTSIDCEVVHQEFAPAGPADSPVVQALSRAVQRETGVRARPKGIGGGTVAALIRRRGYPAAVWSTILNNAHQPNEHTRISHIIRDATVFASMLLDPDLGGCDATHG